MLIRNLVIFRRNFFPTLYSKNYLNTSVPDVRVPGKKCLVKNMRLHYEKVGHGTHPVICLPGALGSTRTDFEHQLSHLDREKLTVIAWDPPGYGFSRPPDKTFSLDFLHQDADLVVELMKTLGYPKFSVLGWSDGGITGLILASNYPDVINKLVVWGANCYVTENDVKSCTAIEDISKWSPNAKKPKVDLYGEDYLQKMWTDWLIWLKLTYKQNKGDICKKEIEKIQCPTLIIHGAKDPLVKMEHPEFLVKYIKDSRLEVFPEGKHNVHERFAHQFNKLVETFLTA